LGACFGQYRSVFVNIAAEVALETPQGRAFVAEGLNGENDRLSQSKKHMAADVRKALEGRLTSFGRGGAVRCLARAVNHEATVDNKSPPFNKSKSSTTRSKGIIERSGKPFGANTRIQ